MHLHLHLHLRLHLGLRLHVGLHLFLALRLGLGLHLYSSTRPCLCAVRLGSAPALLLHPRARRPLSVTDVRRVLPASTPSPAAGSSVADPVPHARSPTAGRMVQGAPTVAA